MSESAGSDGGRRESGSRPTGLTQDELAAVLRRAAELDSGADLAVPADAGEGEGRLDPAAVEAAALEVGLSRAAVRRAISEVVRGVEPVPSETEAPVLLPQRHLVVSRELPVDASRADEAVARFLNRQLFDQRRIYPDGSSWSPRKGWAADLRRNLDWSARFALQAVRHVEVRLVELSEAADPEGPRVEVRLILDMTPLRTTQAAYLGGGAVGATGVLAGAGILIGLEPVALVSLPAAAGVAYGGHALGRRRVRSEIEAVHTAVAGMLDRVEHPDRDRRGGHRRSRSRPGDRDER